MSRKAEDTETDWHGQEAGSESAVILGFDPGGAKGDHFGWAVLLCASLPPLEVLASGNRANAREAVHAALRQVNGPRSRIAAAAIDAPLSWVAHDGRQVDKIVRLSVVAAGCSTAAGTVQHVNSLQGACLVGGMMAALELRRQMPNLLISEAHPKALLWLLGPANRAPLLPGQGKLGHMRDWLTFASASAISEHERDAAIGGLSAWAMVYHPHGWADLYCDEDDLYSPVASNLGYWMPKYDLALRSTARAVETQ